MTRPTADRPFQAGTGPEWACAWGIDTYGAWADLAVRDPRRQVDVVQRFRWIPPGSFWVGSPDDEAGRWKGEGPVHRVTLTRGFWLGDTPVTQALWVAVRGENPSHFAWDPAVTTGSDEARRPVEQVNWEDCLAFCDALADVTGGPRDLRLPTEAEWEYALGSHPSRRWRDHGFRLARGGGFGPVQEV